jgi:mono/diheme cytochrome c family protein
MYLLIRAARSAALTLVSFAVFVACGDSGSRDAAPAPSAPAATPAAPAQPAAPPAQPTAPPEAAAPAPAAEAAAAGDPAQGAGQYALYCASCHGEKGCGDGPLSASLDPKPAKHCDGNVMNAMTDEYLLRVVKEGGAAVGKSPLMAPWGGTLTDAQIRDVIAFVRSLAVPAYQPGS